jgi:hypothetical protein
MSTRIPYRREIVSPLLREGVFLLFVKERAGE